MFNNHMSLSVSKIHKKNQSSCENMEFIIVKGNYSNNHRQNQSNHFNLIKKAKNQKKETVQKEVEVHFFDHQDTT